LSLVEIVEKDGVLWTSPSQQHSIRDDKELGSELGKDGLNPALTFSAKFPLGIPSKGVSLDRIS
jgi:hypothetical protein